MKPRGLPGTAFVIKGEPKATDAARLRRALDDDLKAELREILGARLRAGAQDPPTEEA